ncbi:MAG: LysR family transcriptional regulator [Rhodobacteraceae bacterium]|nr:LysR family transcriptional regulator [Paracoccaceae bacterium]
MTHPRLPLNLLDRGLKITHLRFIAALAQAGGMQRAANHLAIAQPAASRLASELEQILGQKIHRRAGKGIELTSAGRALAGRAKRILQEIDDAEQEISELQSGLAGTVRIGSVTGPAIEFILPVLKDARIIMPSVNITVEVTTSDILASRLAKGELDFILGRIPVDMQPELFEEVPIASEPVSFIARSDHPLVKKEIVSVQDLMTFDWVLPFEGTVLQQTIAQALRQRGHSLPERAYTTSSFLLTLALVRQTNSIAPLATSVATEFAHIDGRSGSLGVISTDLTVSVETFSLLKSSHRQFSPATNAVYSAILKLVKQFQAS